MSFKRSLVKFATVLSVFFTGISFINVPLQTQTVQAASQSKTEKRNAVVQLAKEQVGKSYVYGATGPSAFDCSGLAQYVYKKAAKKTLPRTTYGQVTKGKKVSLSHLKKGDLLLEFDVDAIKKAGYPVVTPVIVTNSDDYKEVACTDASSVNVGDSLIDVKN